MTSLDKPIAKIVRINIDSASPLFMDHFEKFTVQQIGDQIIRPTGLLENGSTVVAICYDDGTVRRKMLNFNVASKHGDNWIPPCSDTRETIPITHKYKTFEYKQSTY